MWPISDLNIVALSKDFNYPEDQITKATLHFLLFQKKVDQRLFELFSKKLPLSVFWMIYWFGSADKIANSLKEFTLVVGLVFKLFLFFGIYGLIHADFL